MISIVGIGPGALEYIVPEAMKRIKSADVLIGGARVLSQFKDVNCVKYVIKADTDWSVILKQPGHKVIMASGDPGLYGITELVKRYTDEDIDIVPGISSVQYMFSRLQMPWHDCKIISLHGREQDVIEAVSRYPVVAVLTDCRHNPVYIAKILYGNGIRDRQIYVGENLSYGDEKIRKFSVDELVNYDGDFDINVVVIR